MSKDEVAGLSLRCHDIESWPNTHTPPLTLTSWSVRLHSALNDVVQVESQPYPLANSSGEVRLNPCGPFRVIRLSLLQTYVPCSGVGRAVQGSVSHLPQPALQPDP